MAGKIEKTGKLLLLQEYAHLGYTCLTDGRILSTTLIPSRAGLLMTAKPRGNGFEKIKCDLAKRIPGSVELVDQTKFVSNTKG